MRSATFLLDRLPLRTMRARGALMLGTAVAEAGRRSTGALVGGFDGVQRPVDGLAWDRAVVKAPALAGATITRSSARGARIEAAAAAGASWEAVDLTGGAVHGGDFQGGRFAVAALERARWEDCDLRGAAFVLVAMAQSEWARCDLRHGRFVGCDWDGALLDRVDLRGADLRGASFRGVCFADTRLDEAIVVGADFRGSAGLDAAVRTSLRERGARVSRGLTLGLALRLAGGADASARARRARKLLGAAWLAAAIAIPLLFFGRAALHPVNPDTPPPWTTP